MKHFWIQATEAEIEEMIHDLRANGFTFTKGEVFKLRSECHRNAPFSCPLFDFKAPAIPSPQPRPWDAVLGGKR